MANATNTQTPARAGDWRLNSFTNHWLLTAGHREAEPLDVSEVLSDGNPRVLWRNVWRVLSFRCSMVLFNATLDNKVTQRQLN